MTSEFKKIKNNEDTHYVLETASSGATSAGAVATAPGKKREDSILAQEKKETPKPRNFVAKNAKMGGAGKMKDKSKTIPRKEKHKKPVAEGVSDYKMVCKDCGDVFNKPTTNCRHDSHNSNGPNWIKKNKGVAEGFNGEYDDEAGMAHTNLLTSARAVMGLLKTIEDKDNLPEWVQEKIAKAEMMLVGVWDYLQSQKEQGIDPQQDANETYGRHDRRDAYQRDYDSSVSGMGDRQSYAYSQDGGGNDERHDLDPSDWYIVKDGKMYKTSVYPRQEQEAIARGYSRTKEEAKSKADSVAEGVDPYFESLKARVEELAKK